MDDYLINFNDVIDLKISDLLLKIKSVKGKLIKDLKVMDLTYYNGKHIYPGVGVYIFRDEKKIKLVGKVSSMSFTERIAKHFDYRKGAWFNRLLTLVCERELGLELNDENFKIASKHCFDNYNLILLNFQYSNLEKINNTERLLRSSTEALNCFKHLKHGDYDLTVRDCT